MLLECGKGGPCPALANELAKAGLTSKAEEKWISKFPVEGFKAPTQKLVQVRENNKSSQTLGPIFNIESSRPETLARAGLLPQTLNPKP